MLAGVLLVLLASVPTCRGAKGAAYSEYYDADGDVQNADFYQSYNDEIKSPQKAATDMEAFTTLKRRELDDVRTLNPEEIIDVKGVLNDILQGKRPESVRARRTVRDYTDSYDYLENSINVGPQVKPEQVFVPQPFPPTDEVRQGTDEDQEYQDSISSQATEQHWSFVYEPETSTYGKDDIIAEVKKMIPMRHGQVPSRSSIDDWRPTQKAQSLSTTEEIEETEDTLMYPLETTTYSNSEMQAQVRKLVQSWTSSKNVDMQEQELTTTYSNSEMQAEVRKLVQHWSSSSTTNQESSSYNSDAMRADVRQLIQHWSPHSNDQHQSPSSEILDQGPSTATEKMTQQTTGIPAEVRNLDHWNPILDYNPLANVRHQNPSMNLQDSSPSDNAEHSSDNVENRILSDNIHHIIPSDSDQHWNPSLNIQNQNPSMSVQHQNPSMNVQDLSPTDNAQNAIPSDNDQPQNPPLNVPHWNPSLNVQNQDPSMGVQHQYPSINAQDRSSSDNVQDRSSSDNVQYWSPSENALNEIHSDDVQPQHLPLNVQHQDPSLGVRHKNPFINIQDWSPSDNAQHWSSSDSVQPQTPPLNVQHWNPSLDIQHQNPSMSVQHQYPSINVQDLSPSDNAQHWSPSDNDEPENSPLNVQHWNPSLNIQHQNPLVGVQHQYPSMNVQDWSSFENVQVQTNLENEQHWSPAVQQLETTAADTQENLPFTASKTDRLIEDETEIETVGDGPKLWQSNGSIEMPRLPLAGMPVPLLKAGKKTTAKRTRLTRSTTTTTPPPPTTTTQKMDIDAIMAIISNLTYDYEWNLTEQFNKTIIEHGVPTCPWEKWGPGGVWTKVVNGTTMYPWDFANTSVVSKCFVCGLKTPEIPRNAYCADAFAGDFLPLMPIDPQSRGKIATFRKYCRYIDTQNYVENPDEPRAIYGRFTGGCAVRWTDITGVYTQRTCRSKFRPLLGKHFASKRMAKLELALMNVENGCIISPMATLLPVSRGISLYARFHACVCSANWCNEATLEEASFNILGTILLAYWLVHYP